MHDDDQPDGEKGRIYQSGIDPHAQRAEYALPPGSAAVDGWDPEYPAEPNRVRRRLLWAAMSIGLGGSFLAGTLTFADERRPGPRKPHVLGRDDEFLQSARRVADGPIADLVFSYETFLMVFEAHGKDDAALWRGIERLTNYAILDRTTAGLTIAQRLLESMRITPPPVRNRHLQFQLQAFIDALKK